MALELVEQYSVRVETPDAITLGASARAPAPKRFPRTGLFNANGLSYDKYSLSMYLS